MVKYKPRKAKTITTKQLGRTYQTKDKSGTIRYDSDYARKQRAETKKSRQVQATPRAKAILKQVSPEEAKTVRTAGQPVSYADSSGNKTTTPNSPTSSTVTSGNTMSAASSDLKSDTAFAKLKDIGGEIVGGAAAALKGETQKAAPGTTAGQRAYDLALLSTILPLAIPVSSSRALVPYVGKALVPIGERALTVIAGKPSVLTKTGITIGSKFMSTTTIWAKSISTMFKNPQFTAKVIAAIVVASLGGKAFGQKFLGTEEAGQSAGIVKTKAYDFGVHQGDWAPYWEIRAQEDEVYASPTMAEEIKSYLGPLAVIEGADKYKDTTVAANTVMDYMASNMETAQELNETPDQTYLREKQQQIDMYNLSAEWNRQQNAIADENNRIANAAYQETQRDADRQAANESAEMWLAYKKKLQKMEEDDRKAIADFWIAYNKRKIKSEQNNQPSNLKFGLL